MAPRKKGRLFCGSFDIDQTALRGIGPRRPAVRSGPGPGRARRRSRRNRGVDVLEGRPTHVRHTHDLTLKAGEAFAWDGRS